MNNPSTALFGFSFYPTEVYIAADVWKKAIY
jgi:hypothetical protein